MQEEETSKKFVEMTTVARIRVQISAAHEKKHIDSAIEAFAKVGKELGVIA